MNIDSNNPVFQSILLKTQPSQDGTVYCYRILLMRDSSQIHYEITVDWQEKHKLLKFRVFPQFDTEEVTSGMQYGSIKRTTIPKNRFTDYKAKYEYPNQQWSSVNGFIENGEERNPSHNYRVTLLNRNKYGIFTAGSCMELSLLKSAKFTSPTSAATLDDDNPRPEYIDRGFHRLSVAIDITEVNDVPIMPEWRLGYEYNYPFNSLENNTQNLMHNWFDLSKIPTNIHIGALKIAESIPQGNNPHPEWFLQHENDQQDKKVISHWIILRLAEYEGRLTDVEIQLNLIIEKSKLIIGECVELDMLERILDRKEMTKNLKLVDGNKIKIQTNPYEIKTIGIKINQ
jgi:alpha-mannosidase